MAISGSLNFLTASSVIVKDTSIGNVDGIPVDFVRMNTIIVDTLELSTNFAGREVAPLSFYKSSYFGGDLADDHPDTLNSLLLNRNGPYQHAMWQQYRGGEHTIASKLRLNNTMSIDQNQPSPLTKHLENKLLQARKEAPNQPDGYFHYPGASSLDNLQKTSTANSNLFPSLTRFYEPSLITKYKPFIYSVLVDSADDEKIATARASFMNQIKFFSNDRLNAVMKLTSGDIVSASAIDKDWEARKHRFYKVLSKSKDLGASGFIYSERLFPKSISAYRSFKLKKPNYEEEAGTSSNGYDRKNPRSFWRNDQGGGSSDATSGTTRLRTDGTAVNSAGFLQETQLVKGTTLPGASTAREIIGGHLIGLTGVSPNSLQTASLLAAQFVENGIVVNQQNTMSGSNLNVPVDNLPDGIGSTTFAQLESYQPYKISLLSMWPLDPRQDIYSSPAYLTSSYGGKGLQIGLTPHKAGNNFGSPGTLFNSSTATALTAITSSILQLLTGSAGELAYSTKPTIFFYRTGSAVTDFDGYTEATASLQYHRHTYPYNTPFFATHKIRNRNPMYNSYDDFVVDDLKYFGRDYSIVPEFRISDNLDYYYKYFFSPQKFKNNPDLFFAGTYHDMVSNKSVKIVGRSLSDNGVGLIHKTDFLKLDGAEPTASSDLESHQGLAKTTTVYDYDHISGPEEVSLDTAKHSYARQSPAVSFYSKYSHADDLVGFSHLMDVEKGFKNKHNTVPTAISFTCHGIKKLLPYNGFYPVTRTTQIGSYFVDFLSPHIGRRSSHPNNAQNDRLPGYLQAFIEPFFGPGLLYNSIKSGIAVEYPVYTNDPYYYAPFAFVSSSHGFHTRSATGPGEDASPYRAGSGKRFQLEASQSFTYGGFQMIGSSRCIPSILNTRPSSVLPFEALYDLSHFNVFKNNPLRLLTDFVDLDRNTPSNSTTDFPADYTVTAGHPGMVRASRNNSHPAATLENYPADIKSYNKTRYVSSINNFLCETIEFFISDTREGTKLPVATSAILSKNDITINTDVKYYMGVSLKMGLHQVMCEGPRNAGIGGGKGVDNDFAGDHKNAKMRGYLYGPPMEIIPHRPSLIIPGHTISGARVVPNFADAPSARPSFNLDGTLTILTASVALRDYETYFAANLQDPAYQAYTPPYFYGESAMILQFSGSAAAGTNIQDIFSEAQSNSIISQVYHTGSGISHDLLGLCKTFPHTGSISSGSLTRMAVEASVDVFNAPIKITDLGSTDLNRDDETKHMWYIAPKWVCPVLDFSSSISAVRLREDIILRKKGGNETIRYSYLTNNFHDNTTGKGMWGGYGTDPYDSEAMQTVFDNMERNDINKIDDTSIAEKGIYLQINASPFQEQAGSYRDLAQRNLETEVDSSRAVDREFARRRLGDEHKGQITGSLTNLLGFEEKQYEIGKIAAAKDISEAVVLIPYFEEPIIIHTNTGDNDPDQNLNKTDPVYGKEHIIGNNTEIFSTREIIPGKHFLPIHTNTFDKALSVILSNRWYPDDPDFIGQGAFDDVLNTDVGNMIDLLLGDSTTGRKGYQLPPEFDFIHNEGVMPFQMIVMPMRDTLSKQDLIDIYQGVMPDPSIELQKIKSNKTRIRPSAPVSANTDWHTFIHGLGTPIDASQTFGLNNFLSPRACLGLTSGHPASGVYSQLIASGYLDLGADYQSIPEWLTSARQFYKKLKFMVFKVKQCAEKDYDTYRKRQIAKAVKHKIDQSGRKMQIPDNFEKVLKNKKFNELYGQNWPYDYFSLIESIKIDVEIEVSE